MKFAIIAHEAAVILAVETDPATRAKMKAAMAFMFERQMNMRGELFLQLVDDELARMMPAGATQ